MAEVKSIVKFCIVFFLQYILYFRVGVTHIKNGALFSILFCNVTYAHQINK